MRNKITVRLFVPGGSGYREFGELTDEEKEAFGSRCAERMAAAMNECLGRNGGAAIANS